MTRTEISNPDRKWILTSPGDRDTQGKWGIGISLQTRDGKELMYMQLTDYEAKEFADFIKVAQGGNQ